VLRLAIDARVAVTGVDVLWWADLPSATPERLGRRTAQPVRPKGLPATTKRLFYIDWPLLDRHRDENAPADRPLARHSGRDDATWIGGDVLRRPARTRHRPHRTQPVFNSTAWGGQWAAGNRPQPEGPNTALGYELICPESGVLVGPTPS